MIEFLKDEDFRRKIFDFTKHQDWHFEGSRPAIINFTASWCGPCRAFAPILEQIATEYMDKVDVYKVDIDQNPQIADLFGIRSVPTTLFATGAEPPAMGSGLVPPEELRRVIQEVLGIAPTQTV